MSVKSPHSTPHSTPASSPHSPYYSPQIPRHLSSKVFKSTESFDKSFGGSSHPYPNAQLFTSAEATSPDPELSKIFTTQEIIQAAILVAKIDRVRDIIEKQGRSLSPALSPKKQDSTLAEYYIDQALRILNPTQKNKPLPERLLGQAVEYTKIAISYIGSK